MLILAEGLEDVRSKLDSHIIRVSSGYRSLPLNRALNSSDKSYHVKALAADFSCHNYGSIADVMDTLSKSSIQFDKLIMEFNSWIHIQFPEDGKQARRVTYTIDKEGVRFYENTSMD